MLVPHCPWIQGDPVSSKPIKQASVMHLITAGIRPQAGSGWNRLHHTRAPHKLLKADKIQLDGLHAFGEGQGSDAVQSGSIWVLLGD